jgi:hypothetical protein
VVAGALFLVALPPLVVALVALRCGKPADIQALQDAPDAGLADRDVVVPLEVHDDLVRTEV